jgi:hypothetical protein
LIALAIRPERHKAEAMIEKEELGGWREALDVVAIGASEDVLCSLEWVPIMQPSSVKSLSHNALTT